MTIFRIYYFCIGRKNFFLWQLLAGYAQEHGLELGSSCIIGMGKPSTLLEQGIYYLAAEKL